MKKTSSVVWRFFDRVEENNRCVSVLCKLCDQQYKYFGNTTNLRTHLVNKHPIQWELLQNGTLDESTFRSAFEDDESTNQSVSIPKRRKYLRNYKDDNVRYSVSINKNEDKSTRNSMPIIEIQRVNVLDNSETENENNTNEETEEIYVEQINNPASDEEWLNDEIYETVETYEPKRKKMKYRKIKREVQTPPPKLPNFVVRQPNSYKYQKPDRVVIDSPPRKDEYSVFGEYIANKLRKFKGSQTCGNIQQLITTILWQAEYGMYDNMDTVRRVILHSVQDMAIQETEVPIEQIELQVPDLKNSTESEILTPKENN